MTESVVLSHQPMGVTEIALTTKARILDAAFEAVADFGLSRLTMEDVATRVGLSRQTLYRYFPTKDDLLLALVLREEEQFLDGVRSAFAANAGLENAIEDAVTFVLRHARRHPLLDRLLETDSELLLPYLTTRAGPVVTRAREVLEELLREKIRGADPKDVAAAADMAVRLLISYTITPPSEAPEHLGRVLAQSLTGVIEGPKKTRKEAS
ncbi:MAG: TetR/AcrR family transcriptional regulator [Actinomycetota bacterium]